MYKGTTKTIDGITAYRIRCWHIQYVCDVNNILKIISDHKSGLNLNGGNMSPRILMIIVTRELKPQRSVLPR